MNESAEPPKVTVTRHLLIGVGAGHFLIPEEIGHELREALGFALGIIPPIIVATTSEQRDTPGNPAEEIDSFAMPPGSTFLSPITDYLDKRDEEEEWLSGLPPGPEAPEPTFEEVHAHESAVPLADEVPPIELVRLDEGRELAGKEPLLPEPGKVSLAEPEKAIHPDSEEDKANARLLELWKRCSAKIPGASHSRIIGRMLPYTTVSRHPRLKNLDSAGIRRELRSLGIEVNEPMSPGPRGKRPDPEPTRTTVAPEHIDKAPLPADGEGYRSMLSPETQVSLAGREPTPAIKPWNKRYSVSQALAVLRDKGDIAVVARRVGVQLVEAKEIRDIWAKEPYDDVEKHLRARERMAAGGKS